MLQVRIEPQGNNSSPHMGGGKERRAVKPNSIEQFFPSWGQIFSPWGQPFPPWERLLFGSPYKVPLKQDGFAASKQDPQ